MSDFLYNLDLALLQLCNAWVADSAHRFYEALELSNQPAWLVAGCTLIALWFTPQRDSRSGEVTLREGQRRVLLLFSALVAAFVSARVLGAVFERARPMVDAPLQVPIDPAVWQTIKDALEMQGAFPSDHAAMFAVITVGVFLANRRLGWLALAVNLFFVVLRVGVGFHWPSDMLVGELIGVLTVFALLSLKPWLLPLLDGFLRGFERFAYLSYPLAFLVMIDFTRKFDLLFTVLHKLKHSVLG